MTADPELLRVLPLARRYARALVGDQAEGDALLGRALKQMDHSAPPRIALYGAITHLTEGDPGLAEATPFGRHLLLLTSLEDFSLADAARVVGMSEADAAEQLHDMRAAVRAAAVTDVLIIEDEPVIAMDLRMLVEGCGHRVTGIAGTQEEAVRMARERPPGLILADINLGRGGNGIVAVRRILSGVEIPVIFVTAYPEQLLMAEGLEPAFVMRKPFDPFTLAVFTYQAINAGRVPLP